MKTNGLPAKFYPTMDNCNVSLTSLVTPYNAFFGYWQVKKEIVTSLGAFGSNSSNYLQMNIDSALYDGTFTFSHSLEYFPSGNKPFTASVKYPYHAATCDYITRLKGDKELVSYNGTCDEPYCRHENVICKPLCFCGAVGKCIFNASIIATCHAIQSFTFDGECIDVTSDEVAGIVLVLLDNAFTIVAVILFIYGGVPSKAVEWKAGVIMFGVALIFVGISLLVWFPDADGQAGGGYINCCRNYCSCSRSIFCCQWM